MTTSRVLEETVVELSSKIKEMNSLKHICPLDEQMLWEELVACILGSRVTFETAYSAFTHLRTSGYLTLSNEWLGTLQWQKKLAKELSRAIFLPKKLNKSKRRYPFPFLRSNHIDQSWKTIYGNGMTLTDILSGQHHSGEKRAKLIESSYGIGPKQASLFLRNLCIAEDVAILDSHVLQYMLIQRLITPTGKAVTRLRAYESVEECLYRYADSLKTKLAELDLAIWVTMRVFMKERNAWAL